jgi:hypothetical protein
MGRPVCLEVVLGRAFPSFGLSKPTPSGLSELVGCLLLLNLALTHVYNIARPLSKLLVPRIVSWKVEADTSSANT